MPEWEEIKAELALEHVLVRQHLASRLETPVVRIADDLVGLHSTSATTPYVSLFARRLGFTRRQLEVELYGKRRLGRMRCMRATVFILSPEMMSIAFGATRSLIEDVSRRYLASRGVLSKEYDRLAFAIVDLLHERFLSVAELRERLRTRADLSGIVNLMCDRGVLIRDRPARGWRNSTHTYSVLSETYPEVRLDIDEPIATRELVRRYIRAFGPVSIRDVIWWTGLPAKRIRAAVDELAADLTEVVIPERGHLLVLGSELEKMGKRSGTIGDRIALLPSLDPFVMGYTEREWLLPREGRDRVFDRSGNATSVIVMNGKIVGVWDTARRPSPTARFHLFEAVPRTALAAIREEAGRVGEFLLEDETEVRQYSSMVPLTRRPAGAVMSPLGGATT